MAEWGMLSEVINLSDDVCARERIRAPGAIQPHGLLIGLDAATFVLVTKSANLDGVLPDSPLGSRPRWLPAEIETACRDLDFTSRPECTLAAEIAGIGRVEAHCFVGANTVFCEFEATAARPSTIEDQNLALRIEAAIAEMKAANDIPRLAALAVDAVRAVSGFERVLVYRFDRDGDGEVIGESLAEDWRQSFLGLRFPATDIPAQARELYRMTEERWLPRRDYEAAPLTPGLDPAGQPFDLGLSRYRDVSPIHRLYQKNIDADGAMSVSILLDGALWGLFIGHHRRPHQVPSDRRRQVVSLVRAFAMRIEAVRNREIATALQRDALVHSAMLRKLAAAEDFLAALTEGSPSVIDLLPDCVGAAVVWDEDNQVKVHSLGEVPPDRDLVALTRCLWSGTDAPVFATDCLSDSFPAFLAYREAASGLLACIFKDVRRSTLLLFRPEFVRSVSWAGKPQKLVGPDGLPNLPRRSFDRWTETRRGRSRPWQPWELDLAATICSTVNDVIVRQSRRIHDLNIEVERSELANAVKTMFLATMSHEIRTPLSGVVGMADLLLDGPLAPNQGECAQTIRASARALLAVVDDILDLTKLDAGKVVIDVVPFRLRQVLDDIELILRPRAAERGLNFTVEVAQNVPDVVAGDPTRLRQILLNLGSNAVKFTDSGGVTFRVAAQEEGRVLFEVKDTGIGMDAVTRDRLFEAFFQANDGMRHHGGSGMGLSICRRLITLMDGSISLESQVGLGSTFRVVLPLATASMPSRTDSESALAPLPPLDVLVAEDNPVNARVLEAIMRRAGHQTTVVGDGRTAVEAASSRDFDLVLMDMRMPMMDGLAATRAIRTLPHPRGRVPILGVTANAFKEDQQRCLQAGMDGYVSKPVTPERLFAGICSVVASRRCPD